MIRKMQEEDLGEVAHIWLDTNLKAHSFIAAQYWKDNWAAVKEKLAQAEINVKSGLVDLDNVEPETFGENGFKDPYDLLEWLCRNRPVEEPVMSHGDYCLPNLFGVGERVTGFIDLGRSGVGDKWCDIAICFRSLNHNYSGKYQKKYQEKYQKKANMVYDEMLLFRELGIKPDWEKIKYYILLDELF